MLKPLLRTLPSMSGNITLACEINDLTFEGNNTYETYIRSASLQPLQNNLYNRRINVNLANGMWEYDVAKFYKYYSNYFYKQNYMFLRDDFAKLDLTSYNSNNDSRNKDYEYGCKHISYKNTGYMFEFFAPVYMNSVDDIPDYFEIIFKFENEEEKKIKVHINTESNINYLKVYIEKYLSKINRNVAYFISNTGRMIYYGIDVEHGGLVDIEDSHMSQYFLENTTINNFDTELCAGFMNNKLIMRQVLPLSFNFNLEDILTSYDKKYFIGHKVNISAHYYKNSLRQKFYDFDINYTNKPVIDLTYAPEENRFVASRRQVKNNENIQNFNLLDNTVLFALHEKYIKKYYYTNAQTPMYTSWKMLLSDDKCPYITNLNYSFSSSLNNMYGQFPKIFLKYEHTDYAKLEGSNLNIIGYKQQDSDNSLYMILQNSYVSNWYTLINRYEYSNNLEQQLLNIIQDTNNWFKVENNYAYYKGILYNFANCEHTTDIDYFAVFINPIINIINDGNIEMYRHTILEDCATGEYGDISLNKSLFSMSNIKINDVNNTNFDKSIINDIFDFDNLFTFDNYNAIKNGDLDANVKKINSTIITGKYNENNLYQPNDLIDNVLYTSIETTNNKENNTYVRYLDVFNQESFEKFFSTKPLNIVLDTNDDLYKTYYTTKKESSEFEAKIANIEINTSLNDKTLYEVINQILSKYIIDNSLTELYTIVINQTNSFKYLLWRFMSLMLKKTNLYTVNNINNADTYHGETLNYVKDVVFNQTSLFSGVENNSKHKWNIFVDTNGQVYEANLYISLSSLKSILKYIIGSIRLEKEQYKDDDPNKAILDRHRYAIGANGLVNTILKNNYEISDLKLATYVAHYIMNHLFEWIVEYIDSCTKYEFIFNDIELRNDMTINSFYATINEIQINKSNNKFDTLTINNLWPFTSSELLLKHINNNNNNLPAVHFIKNGYVEQEFKLDRNNPFNIITTNDVPNYHKVLFIDAAYLNSAERHKFIDQTDDKNLYKKYYQFIKDMYGVPYTFFTNNNNDQKNIIENEYSRYINFNLDDKYEIPDFDVFNILGIYSSNFAITKGPQYFFDLQNCQLATNIQDQHTNINQFLKYYHGNNAPIDMSFIYTPLKVTSVRKPIVEVQNNIEYTTNGFEVNHKNLINDLSLTKVTTKLSYEITYSYNYINTILLNTNKLSSKLESFGTLEITDDEVMQIYYNSINGYERVLNNEPTYVNYINDSASNGSIDGSYIVTYDSNYVPSGNINNIHDIVINNLYQYLSTILTQSLDTVLPRYDIRYNQYFTHNDKSSYGIGHSYNNDIKYDYIDRVSYIDKIDNNVCFHTVLSRIVPNESLDRLKFEIQIGAPITFKSDILKQFTPVMNNVLCDGKYDFIKDIITKYDEERISRFYKYNINDSNIYNILITHAMSESKNIESWRNLNSIYFAYPMLYDNMMKLFIDNDDVYMFYGSPFLILPGILPFIDTNVNQGINVTYDDDTQYVKFGSIPFVNEGYFDDDIYIRAFYDDQRLYRELKHANIWEDYLTLVNWLDTGVNDQEEARLRIKYNIPDNKFTKDSIYRTIRLHKYITDEFYNGAQEFFENRQLSIQKQINDINRAHAAILIDYKENESDAISAKFHNVINGIYFSINKNTGQVEMPANKMAFDTVDEYDNNVKLYNERYDEWLTDDANMFTYSADASHLSNEDKYMCAKYAIIAKYNDSESWFPIPNTSYQYIATSGYYNILSFWKSLVENVKYEYQFSNNRDYNLSKQESISNDLKSDSRYTNTMSLITQLKDKANYGSIKQINDTNEKHIYRLYDNICDLYDNSILRQNYDKYAPKSYNSNSHALFMLTDLSFNEDFIKYSCVRPESINNPVDENRLCPIDTTKLSLYVYPNIFTCSEFATLQDISNYIQHKDKLHQIISNETNSNVTYNEYDFAHMSSSDKVYDDNVRIALVSSLKNSYLHNVRNFAQVLKYYKANNTSICIKHIKEYIQKTIESLVDQSYCYDKTWQNCIDLIYDGLVTKVKDIVDRNRPNINKTQLSTEEMQSITNIKSAHAYYSNFNKLINTVANIRKEISQLPEIMYINYIMQQLMILSTSDNQINSKDIINHLDEYPTVLANILDSRHRINTSNVPLYTYVDASYNKMYKNHKVSSDIINNNRIKTLYYNGLVTDQFMTLNYFNKKYNESEYDSHALKDAESYKIIHNILSQCNFDNFIKQTRTTFKSTEWNMYDLYYANNDSKEYSLYKLEYKKHTIDVSIYPSYEYLYEYSINYAPSSLSFENTYSPWVKYNSYDNSINQYNISTTLRSLNHNMVLNLIESSDVYLQKSIDTMFEKYQIMSNVDYINIGNDALYNIVGLNIDATYKTSELNSRVNTIDRNYIINTTVQIDTKNNNLHKILYDIILPLAKSMNIYRRLLETVKLYKITNRANNTSLYDNVESFKLEKIYDGKYVSSFMSTEFENHMNDNDDLARYTGVMSLWNEYDNTNHDKNYQFKYIFENGEYEINDNNYFKHIHEIMPIIETHYINHLINSSNIQLKYFNSFYIDLYAKKQLLPLDEYLVDNMHNGNYQYYLYQLCEREDNYSSLLSFDKESSNNNLTNMFDENVTNNMLNINDDSNIHYAKLFNLTESNIYKNNTDKKMFESLESSNYIKAESCDVNSVYAQYMGATNETPYNVFTYQKPYASFALQLNNKENEYQHELFANILSKYIINDLKYNINEDDLVLSYCNITLTMINIILSSYEIGDDIVNNLKEQLTRNNLYNELMSILLVLENKKISQLDKVSTICKHIKYQNDYSTSTSIDINNISIGESISKLISLVYNLLIDYKTKQSLSQQLDVYGLLYENNNQLLDPDVHTYYDIVTICQHLNNVLSYWNTNIAHDKSWNYDISFENIILTNDKRSLANINIDLENLYNVLINSSLNCSIEDQLSIRHITLSGIILKNIFRVMPHYTYINKIIDECLKVFMSKYIFKKSIFNELDGFVYEYVYELISNAYLNDVDKEILTNVINYNILTNDMKLYFYMSSNNISFTSLANSLGISYTDVIEDTIDNIDENLHILTFKSKNDQSLKYGYYCINLNVSNTSMQYYINESNMMMTFDSINNSTFDENMFVSRYFNILYPLLRTPVLLNFIQSSKILQKPYQFSQRMLLTTTKNNLLDYQTCYFEYDLENHKHHFIKELDHSYDLYYLSQISQVQTVSLNRYLNHIEPCIFETTDIKDFKSKMFKTNNIIFGGANIFTEDININKYNPLIVFGKLDKYNTVDVYKENTDNNVKYNIAPYFINQYEYKHFNDNNLFLLENQFEYESKKLYTYNELLLAESHKIVYEIFTNYIQKRHHNESISENEILFLFNKYNVIFKSNFIKFDITLTNKLYTLKYIFSLK